MLHDTHAHLEMLLHHKELLGEGELPLTQEAEDYLHNALSGHSWVIQPTVSIENYKYVTRLFNDVKLPCSLYFLLGAHPEIVTDSFDVGEYIQEFKSAFTTKPDIVGVGEIGLDYFYTQDVKIVAAQQKLFRFHIEQALEWDLPIVIHCRDAFEDLFTILDEYPGIHNKFLIHCFTGNSQNLQDVLTRGGMVAYGGVSTFKNAKDLQQTILECPLDKFVFETDLPYLAPTPHRGKTCEPQFIDDIARHHGDIRGTSLLDIWEKSNSNSQVFFSI